MWIALRSEGAAAEVVEHAAGCPDHDVDAALELLDLAADRLAAVDRRDANAAVLADLGQLAGDLEAELAGWQSTMACTSRSSGSIELAIGIPNAAVLPVPVCDCPTTSRPSIISGITMLDGGRLRVAHLLDRALDAGR